MLDPILKRFVVQGRLSVRWPDGRATAYGGQQPGPEAAIAITDKRAAWAITFDPGLKFGECYMDGTIQPLDCSIYDVLDVMMTNMGRGGTTPVMAFRDR